jgi:hypothetical protein
MEVPDNEEIYEVMDESDLTKTNSNLQSKRLKVQNLLTQQQIHDTQKLTVGIERLNSSIESYILWARLLTLVLVFLSFSLLLTSLIEMALI